MQPAPAREILDALDAHGQLSVTELSERLDTHPVSVDRQCYDLQSDGYIRQVTGGIYTLTADGEEQLAALDD